MIYVSIITHCQIKKFHHFTTKTAGDMDSNRECAFASGQDSISVRRCFRVSIFLMLIATLALWACSRDWNNPLDLNKNEQNQLPSDGLVSFYSFNGDANDHSGNGNNGVINGAVFSTDRMGKPGRSLHFNGVNSFVEIPNNTSLNFSSTFSMTMWIKTASINNNPGRYPMIIAKYSPYNDRSGYGICVGAQNDYQIYFELFSHNSQSDVGTDFAINDNRWHFLAAIRDGSTQYFYVDNTLIGVRTFSRLINNSYSLYIGGLPLFSYDNFYFEGLIDDVRLFDRALSKSEVELLYHEGDWVQ